MAAFAPLQQIYVNLRLHLSENKSHGRHNLFIKSFMDILDSSKSYPIT